MEKDKIRGRRGEGLGGEGVEHVYEAEAKKKKER